MAVASSGFTRTGSKAAALAKPARAAKKTGITAGGRKPLGPVDPDYVRFRAVQQQTVGLTVELTDDVIAPTGYPTRDTLSRPTISTPAGSPPLAMRIPLILDRWTQRSTEGIQLSVEPEMQMIDRLYGLGDHEAPIITIEGRAVPYCYERYAMLRWAFNGDPEYGEVRKKANGDRVYVELAINVVQVPGAAGREGAAVDPANPRPVSYKVPKAGGHRTLRAIAKVYRTTPAVLRKLNPSLPDASQMLKDGTRVRIS